MRGVYEPDRSYAGVMDTRGAWRDWLLYPALLLGALTWPVWGTPDLVRHLRFTRRFAGARSVKAFDGERLVDVAGAAAIADVERAYAWEYQQHSMASGAEETLGLEVRMKDGTVRRYAGSNQALYEAHRALVAAGKAAAEPSDGGTSGGVARPLMLLFWMVLVALGGLYLLDRVVEG